jgi:hypothetical protein
MMQVLRLDWLQSAQSDFQTEALELPAYSEQRLAMPVMNPVQQPRASGLAPKSEAAAAAAAEAAAAAAAAAAAGTVFRRHYSHGPQEEASTSCAELQRIWTGTLSAATGV